MTKRLLSFGVIGITWLSLTSYFAWTPYLELISHFKLQYFLISLLFVILLMLNRSKRWVLVALFCIAVQLTAIAPWYITPTWVHRAQQSDLRIFLANVYVKNHRYEKVLSLIKQENPDIAVFLEVDRTWIEQLLPLKATLPYFLSTPDAEHFGIAIYSRFPLKARSLDGLNDFKRPYLISDLTFNHQTIAFVAVHPDPPKPNLFQMRNQQLHQLSQTVSNLKVPVVVAGDFNTTMWSPFYSQLIQKTGLNNTRSGFGILPTWSLIRKYVDVPILTSLLSIPIDHCLVSPTIPVVSTRVGSPIGSDHLPLIVDLNSPTAFSILPRYTLLP